MTFIARGVIASTGANPAWVGRFTYVSEPNFGFYQWDGLHKAKLFATSEAALAAAADCRGPLFQLPMPESIEALEQGAARRSQDPL